MTQFVAVKFHQSAFKIYTYHWDGDPLAVGDQVKVQSGDDPDSWTRVTIDSITTDPPPFRTKPILGKAPADG